MFEYANSLVTLVAKTKGERTSIIEEPQYLRETVTPEHSMGGRWEEEVNRVKTDFINVGSPVLRVTIDGRSQESEVSHCETCSVGDGQSVVKSSSSKPC